MPDMHRTMLFEKCIYPSACTNQRLHTEGGGKSERIMFSKRNSYKLSCSLVLLSAIDKVRFAAIRLLFLNICCI